MLDDQFLIITHGSNCILLSFTVSNEVASVHTLLDLRRRLCQTLIQVGCAGNVDIIHYWHSDNNRVVLGGGLQWLAEAEEGDCKTDGLPTERVRPCLSLCLSNIISLRGCFRTYSSALCIRPKELRRRSLTPFTTVVASLSSTSGGMHRKRGTVSRNTCRKYGGIKIEILLQSIKRTIISSGVGQDSLHKGG